MSNVPQELPSSIIIDGITVPSLDVHMIHPALETYDTESICDSNGLKSTLPLGFQIRTYRPGDESIWLEIIRDAEEFFVVEETLFEQQFGDNSEHLADRMFFVDWITPDGVTSTVGTATAWWRSPWIIEGRDGETPTDRGEWAQVHWVAVVPDHQGKGLAKPLMDHVIRRMAKSHGRAMLGTSTARIWAVKVYLDLGFVPDLGELRNPAVENAWKQVQKVLMHSALRSTFE